MALPLTTGSKLIILRDPAKDLPGGIVRIHALPPSRTNRLLLTTVKCYNAHYSGCATATVSSPITQTHAYSELLKRNTRLSQVLYNEDFWVGDRREDVTALHLEPRLLRAILCINFDYIQHESKQQHRQSAVVNQRL